jgi:hypothetical protein
MSLQTLYFGRRRLNLRWAIGVLFNELLLDQRFPIRFKCICYCTVSVIHSGGGGGGELSFPIARLSTEDVVVHNVGELIEAQWAAMECLEQHQRMARQRGIFIKKCFRAQLRRWQM